MKLHELKPTEGSRKSRKRIGRGDSSGYGKTAEKKKKGQKSRTGSKSRPFFEGGQIPLFRRLPVGSGSEKRPGNIFPGPSETLNAPFGVPSRTTPADDDPIDF